MKGPVPGHFAIGGPIVIPPSTIPEVKYQAAVWATALLASALRATKSDRSR